MNGSDLSESHAMTEHTLPVHARFVAGRGGAADAKDALASLYQKTDGTMRTCRHYPDSICTMRRRVKRGCQRAADILRGEPPVV